MAAPYFRPCCNPDRSMKKMRPKRVLKLPTPESLAGAALSYLARNAASEASLRRVLENRLRRAARLDPAFAADRAKREELRSAIDTIVEKHLRLGTLDDAAYAGSRVASLRRAGRSRRFIRLALGKKGVRGALTEDALAAHDEGRDPHESDLAAARAFAKRRRLGPYRVSRGPSLRKNSGPEDRKNIYRKDLAALARAGFPLETAREALDGKPGEEGEDSAEN
jgi:regulatory protein